MWTFTWEVPIKNDEEERLVHLPVGQTSVNEDDKRGVTYGWWGSEECRFKVYDFFLVRVVLLKKPEET